MASSEDFPDHDNPAEGTVFTRFLRPATGTGTPDVLRLLGDDGLVAGLTDALDDGLGRESLAPSELAIELTNSPLEQRLVPRTEQSRSTQ